MVKRESLSPPENPEVLRKAILQLLENNEYVKSFGEQAKARAGRFLPQKSLAENLAKVFKKVNG